MTEYEIWSLAIQGAVAIGTISAVFVALKLAKDNRKPKFLLNLLDPHDSTGEYEINITNIGNFPVHFQGFFLCTGNHEYERINKALQLCPKNDTNILYPGGAAYVRFQLRDIIHVLPKGIKSYKLGEIDLCGLCSAFAAKSFRVPITNHLRSEIKQYLEQQGR